MLIVLILETNKTNKGQGDIIKGIGDMTKTLILINERTKRTETDVKEALVETIKRITSTDYLRLLKTSDDPLTPEQIKRRDELLEKGKLFGLSGGEVTELKAILEEGAREASAGNVFALLAFLFFIGLLLASLSKE